MSSLSVTETKSEQLESTSVSFEEELIQWLELQATRHELTYLLAHADDGIIWGRFEAGKLKTADQASFRNANLPLLRLETLQQCRLFSPEGEIFLWPSGSEWRSRHISSNWEASLPKDDYFDEAQLLWGTHGKQQKGFTLLRDGSQGLKHAIPITEGIVFESSESEKLATHVRLTVRHYITYSEDGVARTFLSRLIDFI